MMAHVTVSAEACTCSHITQAQYLQHTSRAKLWPRSFPQHMRVRAMAFAGTPRIHRMLCLNLEHTVAVWDISAKPTAQAVPWPSIVQPAETSVIAIATTLATACKARYVQSRKVPAS